MVSKLASCSSQENKLKFWHNLFLELENSPVSIKKFCAKHEISSSTLYKWKKIFQGGDNKNVDCILLVKLHNIPPRFC